MNNSNCLAGMQCPDCGSEGPFDITAKCVALVFDDGVEEAHDYEWDDNDACHCRNCGRTEDVATFYLAAKLNDNL